MESARAGAGSNAVWVARRGEDSSGVLRLGGRLMNRPLTVAVIADYVEERWPSMDLVAEMLAAHLAAEHQDAVQATLIRPVMPRRFSHLSARAWSLDRVT